MAYTASVDIFRGVTEEEAIQVQYALHMVLVGIKKLEGYVSVMSSMTDPDNGKETWRVYVHRVGNRPMSVEARRMLNASAHAIQGMNPQLTYYRCPNIAAD